MPIVPLPQFEADLAEFKEQQDREAYERLQPPKTIVVRYGLMKMIGEFPYDGQAKPGCGSKLVVRTFRGTEIGEMLTSTCPNSGCSKSVSRQDMLRYIENSGGRNFPFSTSGRVLRVATQEDLTRQSEIEQSRHEIKMDARRRAEARRMPLKVAEAEPILGGERLTIYVLSEERPDVSALTAELREAHGVPVDIRPVGARDEARLTADYERCGQYCCCKNFLKVLKPISMRSAKTQKATLDPLKISGRCGRLMCCLRYEDQTYEDLRKRLPRRKTRVGTPDGDGIVIDGQILTQLVLVELDGTMARVAVPVEEITEPTGKIATESPIRQRPGSVRRPTRPERPTAREAPVEAPAPPVAEEREVPPSEGQPRKRRRRRRRSDRRDGAPASGPNQESRDDARDAGTEGGGPSGAEGGQEARSDGPGDAGQSGGATRKRRRRRRRRSGPGEGPGPNPASGGS
ncbi:MAG: hypothetical protein H6811_03230 [Phycisphaeraceae bacterium]|nr:hypothetical protein [Phycisphaeraceae bacterium]